MEDPVTINNLFDLNCKESVIMCQVPTIPGELCALVKQTLLVILGRAYFFFFFFLYDMLHWLSILKRADGRAAFLSLRTQDIVFILFGERYTYCADTMVEAEKINIF